MPIKKKQTPSSTQEKLQTKKPASKARPARPVFGAPLDPATLPGAKEAAPSLANKRYLIRNDGADGFDWFFVERASSNPEDWKWRQCGAAVVVEYHTRRDWVRYIGRLEGDIIKGTGDNFSGETWSWTAEPSSNTSTLQPEDYSYDSPL